MDSLLYDGRGENKRELALHNATRVKEWVLAHPTATLKDCCEALTLSDKTVRKHLAALRTDLATEINN